MSATVVLLVLISSASAALDAAFAFAPGPCMSHLTQFCPRPTRGALCLAPSRATQLRRGLRMAAGDVRNNGGWDDAQGIPTRVELSPPLMSQTELKRYVRTDIAIRTLRADLPRVLDLPFTKEIYADNVTMGGSILGGTVASGRYEFDSGLCSPFPCVLLTPE